MEKELSLIIYENDDKSVIKDYVYILEAGNLIKFETQKGNLIIIPFSKLIKIKGKSEEGFS